MRVEFWGAAQTVTGSMHLVHCGGKRLLLDCGLYQGRRNEAYDRNRDLPFKASDIDAVILSHAHIDHSGNLPSLIRGGFRGPIYTTSASRDLAVYLLLDSAKIQKSDIKYVNKKRKRQNLKPYHPLYREEDAVQTIRQFRTVEWGKPFSPLENVSAQFHIAGHMLGASVVEVNLAEPGAKPVKLVFSGDIGRSDMPILKDPVTVNDADYLIMEATYGDRNHEQGSDARAMLLEAARTVYQSGGKLIIPAFSVGRTQEIVYRLNQLWEENELPRMKVFVDSPLAVNATDVFREHVECFDDEAIEHLLSEEDEDPLAFGDLHYIRDVKFSKELNNYRDPCIIISASGMCESGRILHHLKNNITKSNTIILFAGYQAPHTLGRIILNGSKDVVKIFGEPYEVKAQVRKLERSSGHADQTELVEWAEAMNRNGNLKQIALVHCELDSARALKGKMNEAGLDSVIIPARGESMIMSNEE